VMTCLMELNLLVAMISLKVGSVGMDGRILVKQSENLCKLARLRNWCRIPPGAPILFHTLGGHSKWNIPRFHCLTLELELDIRVTLII